MTSSFRLLEGRSGCCLLALALLCGGLQHALAADSARSVLTEDFSDGAARWKPGDSHAWKIEKSAGKTIYRLIKQSDYEPPFHSPKNFSLLKDMPVGDFTLTAKVRSTKSDYGHRDVCLVFGYQNPSHFYYVHFGKKTDDHSNQIFAVDGAPRVKISDKTTPGTDWNDDWHTLRVERDVKTGAIRTFFDDMRKPVMTATDKRFASGLIGIGSFDDTADFAEVRLDGVLVKKQVDHHTKEN